MKVPLKPYGRRNDSRNSISFIVSVVDGFNGTFMTPLCYVRETEILLKHTTPQDYFYLRSSGLVLLGVYRY